MGSVGNFRIHGSELFFRQRKKSRSPGRLIRGRDFNRLPSLERLLKIQPSTGEYDGGIGDIPLKLVRGSENRSDDFTGDFLPRRVWMEERWVNILAYMTQREAIESIEVIEYGGYYFVRDGNHRVSVAKTLNYEFITARIRRLESPLPLPRPFDCSQVPLWKEMVSVNRKTGIYEKMDLSDIDIRRTGSWTCLEKIIRRDWGKLFLKEKGRPPASNRELRDDWQKNSYAITMAHIKSHSLHYLFPRWGSTDIYIDFMKFCSRQDESRELWLTELYRAYSLRLYRRRFLLFLLPVTARALRSATESREKALDRFKQVTRQADFIPEFVLPSCTKRLIRYLYRQVYFQYALFLKKKYRRAPYIEELTLHWYRNFYEPLYRHYETLSCRRSFTAYYIGFSKAWFAAFQENPAELSRYVGEYCGSCPLNGHRALRNTSQSSPRST